MYPIFVELFKKENQYTWDSDYGNIGNFMHHMERSGKAFETFQRLLLRYGKTNKQIAKEVKEFVYDAEIEKVGYTQQKLLRPSFEFLLPKVGFNINIEFYADYCSYDWVVFCWLFGKMIDLPKGFPMYCNDIEQIKVQTVKRYCAAEIRLTSFPEALKRFKKNPDYPKQDDAKKHHALEDARYDRDLYNFLNSL